MIIHGDKLFLPKNVLAQAQKLKLIFYVSNDLAQKATMFHCGKCFYPSLKFKNMLSVNILSFVVPQNLTKNYNISHV
jgi:hypothetical protein